MFLLQLVLCYEVVFLVRDLGWQSLEDSGFASRCLTSKCSLYCSKKFCKITEEFNIASSFRSSYLHVISHFITENAGDVFCFSFSFSKENIAFSLSDRSYHDPVSTNTKTFNSYFLFLVKYQCCLHIFWVASWLSTCAQ